MTFTFTDNRPIHKHVVVLSVAQLAAHLMKDEQFVYYWRKGWDPMLAANRSLGFNPPDVRAAVVPRITEEGWVEIERELSRVAV